MIDSHNILPSNVIEAYQQRLRDSAGNARAWSLPRESVMRRKLGALFINLGERVQGQRSSAITEPADVRLATR